MKMRSRSSVPLVFLFLVALLATGSSTATFTASVDCDFVRSGRGVCEAWPQGAGYSYTWYGSGGASVSQRDAPIVSAACGGNFGSVTVRVDHSSGTTDWASTDATCN